MEGLFAQVTHTPWQIHKGEGPIDFDVRTNKSGYDRMGHGNPRAYELKSIPPKNDSGWKPAPMQNGEVFFQESSTIPCQEQIDFTYFQTIIDVPSNVRVNELTISYDNADDGARIYFFNSKYPNGHFNPEADLRFNHPINLNNINLADQVAVGENRVVVVQFDDCATGNNVSGIHIKVNGEEIQSPPEETSIKILSANYGIERTVDVTSTIQEIVNQGETNTPILNYILLTPKKLSDPAVGRKKRLNITYTKDGKEINKTVMEGSTLTF